MNVNLPRFKAIMQRVESPGELPGAKVLLPALLVEISEEQHQQEGDHPRHDHHIEGKAVHERQRPSPDSSEPKKPDVVTVMFSYDQGQHKDRKSTRLNSSHPSI